MRCGAALFFLACSHIGCVRSIPSETIPNGIIDGFLGNKAIGKSYRMMYQSKDWRGAVKACAAEGGKLAVPRDEAEFKYLQSLMQGMYFPAIKGTTFKRLAWLGISSLDDFRVWKTVDGEPIKDASYHTWTVYNGLISENPAEPHCAVVDAVNPGLRDWWCHRPQLFICEIDFLA